MSEEIYTSLFNLMLAISLPVWLYSVFETFQTYKLNDKTFNHGFVFLRKTIISSMSSPDSIPTDRIDKDKIRYKWISDREFLFSPKFKLFSGPLSGLPFKGVGTLEGGQLSLVFRAPIGIFLFICIFTLAWMLSSVFSPATECVINGVSFPVDSPDCKQVKFLPYMIIGFMVLVFAFGLRFLANKSINTFAG